jgi:uncharacterized protein
MDSAGRAGGADPLPFRELPRVSRKRFDLVVGTMADGSEMAIPVSVITGAHHGPRLVCIAGVHGNEYEGITALVEVMQELRVEELSGTLVAVTVANPPAFRARTRRSPEDDVDMNRVFPGKPDGTASERIAWHLFTRVVVGADFVLSLHGWTSRAMVVPYVEFPRNSPVTGASRAAADAFGLPYVEAFDWPEGLLVAASCRAGIPAIEPEIGGLDCTLPGSRALYVSGIRRLLAHLGMVAGTEPPASVPVPVSRATVHAPAGGLVLRRFELGDRVATGDVVAIVTDLAGEPIAEARSPSDGFVAAQLLAAATSPGESLAVVFREISEE